MTQPKRSYPFTSDLLLQLPESGEQWLGGAGHRRGARLRPRPAGPGGKACPLPGRPVCRVGCFHRGRVGLSRRWELLLEEENSESLGETRVCRGWWLNGRRSWPFGQSRLSEEGGFKPFLCTEPTEMTLAGGCLQEPLKEGRRNETSHGVSRRGC